ncbi:MAG: FHA domain-containing protein [Clostridia bacterium]|nr:FHA domain-containing protein [Clostridia bacterium]
MSTQAYELISMLMRYVFVLIGLTIVWRSYRWLRRDARAYRKEMRSLPDAGLVGEMVNLSTGEAQPLPREGVIGASRECDIRLKGPGVERNHARFEFEDGKGLKVIPLRRASVLVNGAPLRGPAYALHGTQLELGGIPLRVRLFAGLNIPYPVPFAEQQAQPWEENYDGERPAEWDAPQQAEPDAEGEAYPYTGYENALPDNPPYDGHYTADGQMTWQYAYSLDELNRAMERQNQPQDQWRQVRPTDQVPDGEESAYGAEHPHRRRRRDRHA